MNTAFLSCDPGALRAGEAADWFLRIQEDASEEELRQWVEWCAADPENLREYERVRETWQGIGQLEQQARKLLPTELTAPVGPVPSGREAAKRFSFTRVGRYSLAAATACTVIASIAWWVYRSDVFAPGKRVFSAQQIANTSATLPDGSTLTLAPRTDVAVDFTGTTRKLELSKGEAYFKVSPDKRKPFVVRTEGFKVVAVGTAFAIKSGARAVEVTVEEGVVEAADNAQTWRVGAGYRIVYDIGSGAARIAAIDAARELAWRDGRLEYFMQPLEAVVADVNRYSNRKIEITDPKVSALKFTGTIFTGSIDDWLGAVQSTFPIQAVSTGDRIVLDSRPAR